MIFEAVVLSRKCYLDVVTSAAVLRHWILGISSCRNKPIKQIASGIDTTEVLAGV